MTIRHHRATLWRRQVSAITGRRIMEPSTYGNVVAEQRTDGDEIVWLRAKIMRLRELLRDARDDVAEIAGQQVKAHRIEQYRRQLAEIDEALSE